MRIINILFLILIAVVSPAQTVQHIHSTTQSWSGGIAGHYGTKYSFEIEFSGFDKPAIPDTIWLEGEPVPLTLHDQYGNNNTKLVKSGNHDTRYMIDLNISHDEYIERDEMALHGKKAKRKPPVPYKGVALLSYKCNRTEHYYEIGKIKQQLPPESYP